MVAVTLLGTTGIIVNVALLLLYLTSAYVRLIAAGRVAAVRRSYLLSVPIAVIFALSYLYLLIWGDSAVRLLALRVLNLVAICNVWIWPALVALQLRQQQPADLTAHGISNGVEFDTTVETP